MSAQFNHIFSGGYSAGYYSYKWSEVLDADAFSVFKENGLFNKSVAQSFRDNVLSKGNSEDPMTLYVRFRGQEPTIKALLERDGIVKPQIQSDENIDKILNDYESIMNQYLSLVTGIIKEKNNKKKNQKMDELSALTPEIQSITQRISEISGSFSEEQINRLQSIATNLEGALSK
jgi:Zn-dependent oligopeptidase